MAFCADPLPSGTPRIAIVVGESSGDLLGAGLIKALKKRYPSASFEGIGGPKMLAEGFHSFFAQDRLAVMGLIEPLARLPELLSIRSQLKKHFIQNPPAVFIGIDAPDFNLDLELALKRAAIPTVHYVSPSVWAWRQGRIKKIAKAVDLMLTLLPFEADFYHKNQVPVKFVGHPLADQIPIEPNQERARNALNLAEFCSGKKVVALMPGSRSAEVERLGKLFFEVASHCYSKMDDIVFLVPSANSKRHDQIVSISKQGYENLPINIIEGNSHLVMEASDAVLMASGTTTLEAMLYKRPMVIAYKVAAFSYWLFSKLVKVKFIGLPNLLAQESLVPEFIQNDAQVESIATELLELLNGSGKDGHLKARFLEQHVALKQDADQQAATAIAALIESSKT